MTSGLFFDPMAALAITPLVSSTCTLLFARDQHFFLRIFNTPENRPKSNKLLPTYFKTFFYTGLPGLVGFLGVTFWSCVGNYYWRHDALVSNQSLKWYLAGSGLALSHLLFAPFVASPIQAIVGNDRSKGEPTELLDRWLGLNLVRTLTVDFAAWACIVVAVIKNVAVWVGLFAFIAVAQMGLRHLTFLCCLSLTYGWYRLCVKFSNA